MDFNLPTSRFALFAICGLQALCAQVLTAQFDLPQLPEVTPASDTFTLSKPISVTDVNKNTQLLVGMENGQLRLAFPNMPGAEAIVPVDGDLVLSLPLPKNYNGLLNDFQLGNLDTFVTGLQEIADPIAGFLMIPPEKTNFHNVFSRYYEAVVAVGDLDDAVALTMRMPWDRLPAEYIPFGETLIFRSIKEGQFEHTQNLLSLLFQSMEEEDFAEIAFRVADALRTEEKHDLAAMVYGSLAQSKDPVLKERSLLWAGYSRAVSGDAEGARGILSQVNELERGDENFLTYCLAQGRLGYADEDVRAGLRFLSRAMVLTAVDATFKPELYYLLTVGYQQSGNTEAADRLAREFAIFYPDNPWLKKYESESDITL